MFAARPAEKAVMPEIVKKNMGKIMGAFILVVLFNACSFNESKIKSIVDREIGSGLIVERARLELEKQLGRSHSRLKSSLMDSVSSKINIEYTEVIVEGRRARVYVRAEVPRLEDIGALFSEARHFDRAKIVDMSVEELKKEINKSSRRPASLNDLHTDVYEFYVDFEKQKEWVANSEHLKKAYSKKNLVIR